MTKRKPPTSVRGAVLKHVEEFGETTIDQAVASVAHVVDARIAIATAKRRTRFDRDRKGVSKLGDFPQDHDLEHMTRKGKHRIVVQAMACLCREGKIRRVRRGVYAPILRLFDENARTA